MSKDKAINEFTYDQHAYERKSAKEDKGGLSKRELHNLKKLERLDKEDAK